MNVALEQQPAESLTSAQIASRIAFANDGIASLRGEESDLALAAVSGDADAVKRIAEVRAQLRQIGEDVALLERARGAALRKESEAAAARDDAYRARHMVIAREKAAELLKLAVRADEMVAAFKACTLEVNRVEREIHAALREADAPARGKVGQIGLSQSAFDLITLFVKGVDSYHPGRPVAETAASAWSNLLEAEGDADGE
jgi:hypothetical protein